MKARIALVVIAAGLVGAAPASAAVTIGSTLQATPDPGLGCPGGCTVAPATIAGGTLTAPAAGVITRWRVRNGMIATPGRLQVLRRNAPDAVEIAHTAQVTIPAHSTSTYEARMPIAAGDTIGLECCTGGGSMFASVAGGSTDFWDPPLSTTPRPTTNSDVVELLVNADIEPDADADEFGDETQDNCAGQPNPSQNDRDHDGRGDACDACPDSFGAQANGCPIPVSPPPPPPNRAPTVRFRTPVSGTAIGPSFRIVLDVADDAGSPTVSVFDDDGTICVLRRAPYACTWTPTGADVGRATLLASAVDSAGLSTLGIVRVRVSRFAAALTQRQRHRKGVTRVTGRLVLPEGVTRAQGCNGTVRVQLRKARRQVEVTRRCPYSARLPFRPGRAKVRFGGNSVHAPT
jgi:hypothetical protein